MSSTVLQGRDGLRLAADVAGPQSAPPVVLLHGGGQTRHAWSGAFRRLVAAGFHVLAYDARGHGESQWASDGDYSTDALSADLLAVIGTLDRPPALVGASMGGITALAALESGRQSGVSALVLVDVAPRLEREGVAHIRDFMSANPDGFATLDEVADAVAAYNPSRPRPKDPSGLMKNLRRGENGRLFWHWDPALISRNLDVHTPDIDAREERMRASARELTLPVLLVRGARSNVVSPQGVQELRELIPHAQVADIAGAGHMVAGDRNDAFNDAVMDFLESVLRGA